MTEVQKLKEYLSDVLGLSLVSAGATDQKRSLPLFLKASFDYFPMRLEGRELLFAFNKSKTKRNPVALKKQEVEMQRVFGLPIVFVFEQLDAYERKRFIQQKIAFIQPGKQAYIPGYLLDLNERYGQNAHQYSAGNPLSMPAQFAVLFHLQVGSLEDLSLQLVADRLRYSAMTISRITQELMVNGLAIPEGRREKRLRFQKQGKGLWEHVKNLLHSPVVDTIFSDKRPDEEFTRKAGMTALSAYSLLAEDEQVSLAMGKEEFRLLKKSGRIEELQSAFGKYKIEIWGYNPLLLSPGKRSVDRLSLYLSMGREQDERIQTALEEMIEAIKW